MKAIVRLILAGGLFFSGALASARAEGFSARCADRSAVEKVYHKHRKGTNQTFEQVQSWETLEGLVRLDQLKEMVLEKIYRREITAAMVAGEVSRIDSTTRAPEMLAELKAALGNDPDRFASAIVRPILVERELRHCFENDDKLHSPRREEAEQARADMIAGKSVDGMTEETWWLIPRPERAFSNLQSAPVPTSLTARSGTYVVEATAQIAQTLRPSAGGNDPMRYFDDLDPELRNVLRVQLRKPGDVSAVIEVPSGFLVFKAIEKSSEKLRTVTVTIPKTSYEEWLARQDPTETSPP